MGFWLTSKTSGSSCTIRTWMCRVSHSSGNLSTSNKNFRDFPSRFAGRGTTFTSYQLGLQHLWVHRRKSRSLSTPQTRQSEFSSRSFRQSLEIVGLVGIGNCPASIVFVLGDLPPIALIRLPLISSSLAFRRQCNHTYLRIHGPFAGLIIALGGFT